MLIEIDVHFTTWNLLFFSYWQWSIVRLTEPVHRLVSLLRYSYNIECTRVTGYLHCTFISDTAYCIRSCVCVCVFVVVGGWCLLPQ